jgi:hypothetical protein
MILKLVSAAVLHHPPLCETDRSHIQQQWQKDSPAVFPLSPKPVFLFGYRRTEKRTVNKKLSFFY